MSKKGRHLKPGSQKRVGKLIDALSGRFSVWQIWQDFIVMFAVSIANSFEGPFRKGREELYKECAGKYSNEQLGIFAEIAATVITELEENPDQDFLGDLFMGLGLGDEWKGQFFTPYHICRFMSAVINEPDIQREVESRGWVSTNDPACGAGALLIAYAMDCKEKGINYQQSILFVGQDIDFLVGMMCYIQLSLLGCAGYVKIGNSLTDIVAGPAGNPLIPFEDESIWFTPMYYSGVWQVRRQHEILHLKMTATQKSQGDGAEE